MRPSTALVVATEFAPSFAWDVSIDNFTGGNQTPIPIFMSKVWIPATDVAIGDYQINSHQARMGSTMITIPIGRDNNYVIHRVTFNDTVGYQVYRFIKNWRNSMFSSGNYSKSVTAGITAVKPSCKILRVRKTDTMGITMYEHSFYVYPSGGLEDKGTSNSEAFSFSVEFTSVGESFEDIGIIGKAASIARSPSTLG